VTDGQVVESARGNPLDFVAGLPAALQGRHCGPGCRASAAGLAGYFGYDAVRHIEKKLEKSCPPDTLGCPTSCCCNARSWRSSTTSRASSTSSSYADPAQPEAYAHAKRACANCASSSSIR
jgi:anthranilate synthase component 1